MTDVHKFYHELIIAENWSHFLELERPLADHLDTRKLNWKGYGASMRDWNKSRVSQSPCSCAFLSTVTSWGLIVLKFMEWPSNYSSLCSYIGALELDQAIWAKVGSCFSVVCSFLCSSHLTACFTQSELDFQIGQCDRQREHQV